ncbi:MAG TPA: oligosaccharide flippase family protein [Solirubrobacteraceae bacterium]|nr:oligosaccharide flippase family protein [Solirubrobacteraceae bacterium]
MDTTGSRSNEELVETTASSLRWITAARVGVELLLLGAMVLLARLIPPSAFGVFAVVIIIQEIALSFPAEGIGSALVQRKDITRRHLQGGLAVSLTAGAALAAITLLLAALVVRPVFGDETAMLVAVATPSFLLGAILAVPMALLRRNLDFRRLTVIDFTYTFLRSALAVVLAVGFGMDASALVLGGLLAVALTLGLGLALAPIPLPRWRSAEIRELLPYGGPAALACVAWTGFRNGDYAIVGARLGTAQAGFYWRAFQLAVEYQRKISVVMSQIAFPVLARTASADDLFALRRRMVQLLTASVFPLLVALVILAPDIIPWVFGRRWEPAVLPTQILAGAGAATVVIDAVGSALMAAGRAKALLGYGVAHFAVYVGAILVASYFGLAAVAIASVAVHAIFMVVAYEILLHDRPEHALRCLWVDVCPATIGCCALLVAAAPVEWLLLRSSVPAFVHVALVGPAGAAAYLAALRLWFPTTFGDLVSLVRRILPERVFDAAARRLLPARRAAA